MKTLTMLLAAYVVMSGSHTYREVFIQAIDKTGASRIECGNSRETCSDLAMLLNEARERRILGNVRFMDISSGTLIAPYMMNLQEILNNTK